MDQDTLDLVVRLCTRAGMIMEDIHGTALGIGRAGHAEQVLLLAHLEDSATRVARLISAARALTGD